MTKHNKAAEFYDVVESMVAGGSTVLDATVEYCERRGLEIESVVPLINRNARLLSLLREEAENTNCIEKTSRLPI